LIFKITSNSHDIFKTHFIVKEKKITQIIKALTHITVLHITLTHL